MGFVVVNSLKTIQYTLPHKCKQAGRAYARRGGGVADCMLYDAPITSQATAPSFSTLSRSPEPERITRGKAELPSHVLAPTYKFGAPTRWASTAKEVMSPASSSGSIQSPESSAAASPARRVARGGQRSQGSDDSWWSSAGVDPSKTVFGKPSSKKDTGALAQALGAGQTPVY